MTTEISESVAERSLDEVEHALNTCKTVADMIDFAAKELEQIRELATGEPYYRDEVIETETKIIRLFAKQISVKRRLFQRNRAIPAEIRFYPSIAQFFRVLSFSPLVAERCNQVRRTSELDGSSQCYAEEEDALTLELLMNTSEFEIHDRFASQFSDLLSCEQIDTLLTALGCLRTAIQILESSTSNLTARTTSNAAHNNELDVALAADSSSWQSNSSVRSAETGSTSNDNEPADRDRDRDVSLNWSYLEPGPRRPCPYAHAAAQSRIETSSGRSSPQMAANRDRVHTVTGSSVSSSSCRNNSPKASHAVYSNQIQSATWHRGMHHAGRTSVSSLPNNNVAQSQQQQNVITQASIVNGAANFSAANAGGNLALGANSASTLSTFSGSSGYGSSPYCSVPPTPSALTKTSSAGSSAAMASKQTPPASPHTVRHVGVQMETTGGGSGSGRVKKDRPVTPGGATPPAKSKSRFLLNLSGFPLIKSKSQESQLGARVQHEPVNYAFADMALTGNIGATTAAFIAQQSNYASYATGRRTKKKPINLNISGSHEALNSKNVVTEGDVESVYSGAAPLSAVPFLQHATFLHYGQNASISNGGQQDDTVSISSGQSVGGVSLQVPPKSPNVFYPAAYQVQVTANASAQHRFESSKLGINGGSCDVCRKRLLFTKIKFCTVCRFKCHRDCSSKAQSTMCSGASSASNDRDSDSCNTVEAISATASPRRTPRNNKLMVDGSSRSPAHLNRFVAPMTPSASHEAQLNGLQSSALKNIQAYALVSTSQSQQDEQPALPISSSNSSTQSTAPSSPMANTDDADGSTRRVATSSSSGVNLSGTSSQPSPFPLNAGGYFQFPPPSTMLGAQAGADYVAGVAGANIPSVTVTNLSMLNTACMTPNTLRAFAAGQRHADEQQQQLVGTNCSNDSDKTLIDSTESDRLAPLRADSIDSPDDGVSLSSSAGSALQSGLSRTVSISATLKEWDIPFESLQRKQVIGIGRFATVYRGNWHGDCAIKVFDMSDAHCEAQLQTFKHEVAVLKKTRHDNLVLFMGACMKPPNLAIVTSLCRGPEHTLFHKIHVLKDKLPLNRAALIASQITQGMSYLHAKRVLHKDLRTKNIFMEGAKVVIADYGLLNVTRFCTAHTQLLSASWLCYLAPEIVRCIAVTDSGSVHFLARDNPQSQSQHSPNQGFEFEFGSNSNLDASSAGGRPDQLPIDYDPFTTQSDVFAFGTVWFELLVSDWPFREQSPDSIIWKIATGAKPEISELQCNKESKALFLACWSHDAQRRPSFTSIYQALERLPKKGLARAPSHPVTRCAEALY